ncbi:hypothetical protein P167DRAFT_547707 [Morchella conica CCBAS932]|uniref:Copper acquisition factor BIM1-like domain-containing protein n=1 Tax=Morchella conica CCBAS932 TaxID=1392247 RepID=A0A3N4KHD4_9PEZI|nr:hypothetical protein P167DRAFT_547707 [Morchella conica CCBAS932]
MVLLSSLTPGWGALLFSWMLLFLSGVSAHFEVMYPAQRRYVYHDQFKFPYPSVNRSSWPVAGGALSFVPIHAFALTTVNIALGNNIDENIDSNPYNVPMVPLFNQTGGNATFCIPKIKIPKKIASEVADGVNATMQVIQLTGTGAALYSCMDITFSAREAEIFAEPAVWNHFCINGTGMGAQKIGAPINGSISSAAMRLITPPSSLSSPLVIAAFALLWSLWIN